MYKTVSIEDFERGQKEVLNAWLIVNNIIERTRVQIVVARLGYFLQGLWETRTVSVLEEIGSAANVDVRNVVL
jgi:hypothetical protein